MSMNLIDRNQPPVESRNSSNTVCNNPTPQVATIDPDELKARGIHCTVCNAPPTAACHSIRWNGLKPIIRPRPFHSRRLKDAERVAERRERLNGGRS